MNIIHNVIYVSGNALDMKRFTCTCGNTCDNNGFYPCNSYGIIIEDHNGDELLHTCGQCNRLYMFDSSGDVPWLRMFTDGHIVGSFQEFYDANLGDEDTIQWMQTCEIGDMLQCSVAVMLIRIKDDDK